MQRMASGELVQAVATLERTVLEEKRLNGIVLRYGFFYGPGTVYAADGSFSGAVLKRAMPILGRGQGTFSFIHVEDAAAATLLALEKEAPEIYNIVDGRTGARGGMASGIRPDHWRQKALCRSDSPRTTGRRSLRRVDDDPDAWRIE